MEVSSLIILFTLCSLAGWVYESIYAIVTTGKWDRRGFLYGPVCPIYGVGVVGIVLLAQAFNMLVGIPYDWWQVFLISFLGSMGLEYLVSWLMEKAFHAYWWDYSAMPLNINGRTCVPAGLLFGAGGVLAIYVIYPAWAGAAALIPAWLTELVSYLIVVVVTVDTTLTVCALTDVQQQVAEADRTFNEHAGQLTDLLASKTAEQVSNAGRIIAETKEGLGLDRRPQKPRFSLRASYHEGIEILRRSALRRVEGFRGMSNPEAQGRLTAMLQSLQESRESLFELLPWHNRR